MTSFELETFTFAASLVTVIDEDVMELFDDDGLMADPVLQSDSDNLSPLFPVKVVVPLTVVSVSFPSLMSFLQLFPFSIPFSFLATFVAFVPLVVVSFGVSVTVEEPPDSWSIIFFFVFFLGLVNRSVDLSVVVLLIFLLLTSGLFLLLFALGFL